jgi:hypothetical protein
MSEVTICNLALSHLGDTANVQSIAPPDSSVQAQKCAQFYYPARNALLEMANWGFATRRATLASVSANPTLDSNGNGPWQFAYAVPSEMLNALAVVPAGAPDDVEAWFGPAALDYYPPYPEGYLPVPGAPSYVPQPFVIETQASGTRVLLTNVGISATANGAPSAEGFPNDNDSVAAVLRYTAIVKDTTAFSPLFTLALSYLLASMLAGPIIKGDAGITAAGQQLQMFQAVLGKASASDANQQRVKATPSVSWIRGR